jgi:hypothetical protein
VNNIEMSLIVSAPPVPSWFEARMDEPEPMNHSAAPHEANEKLLACKRCAWKDKQARARTFQWPFYYAAEMTGRIAARLVLEGPPTAPEPGPDTPPRNGDLRALR